MPRAHQTVPGYGRRQEEQQLRGQAKGSPSKGVKQSVNESPPNAAKDKCAQCLNACCENTAKRHVALSWIPHESAKLPYRTKSFASVHIPRSITGCSSSSNLTQQSAEARARGDYKIYEGGDLGRFFSSADTGQPQRVSDVCLVNDHFILVKMPPDTCWPRNSPSNCTASKQPIVRKGTPKMGSSNTHTTWPPTSGSAAATTTPPNSHNPCPFAKYLQGKRNRKVSPMRPANDANLQLKKKRSAASVIRQLTVEGEVFRSHTHIKKISVEERRDSVKEQPLNLSVKRRDKQEAAPCSPLQRLDASILQSSTHNEVQLHPQGCLRLADDLPYIDEDAVSVQEPPSARSGRSVGPLRWLIRPFRQRSKPKAKAKAKKPHPKVTTKVQAVVYKTYFVNWRKPPEVTPGLRSGGSGGRLRRCRSALF